MARIPEFAARTRSPWAPPCSNLVAEMTLTIPDAGFQLESSAHAAAFLPTQAFAITIDDSVIEDLISCVQNGSSITLALGNNPVSRHPSPMAVPFLVTVVPK